MLSFDPWEQGPRLLRYCYPILSVFVAKGPLQPAGSEGVDIVPGHRRRCRPETKTVDDMICR